MWSSKTHAQPQEPGGPGYREEVGTTGGRPGGELVGGTEFFTSPYLLRTPCVALFPSTIYLFLTSIPPAKFSPYSELPSGR
jgi:hypothetical protein